MSPWNILLLVPKALGDLLVWFQTDADYLDYLEWLR